MGMYTQINLSCIIKPEYISEAKCFTDGEWKNSRYKELSDFGNEYAHADWVSFHATSDCFYPMMDNTFDPKTGRLELSCAFKDWDNTSIGLYKILPLMVESLDCLEEISEQPLGILHEWYELLDGVIVRTRSEGGNVPYEV